MTGSSEGQRPRAGMGTRNLSHVRTIHVSRTSLTKASVSNSTFTGTKYVTIIYTEKIVAVLPTSTVIAATPVSTSTVTVTNTSTSTVLRSSASVTSTFSTTQTITTIIPTSSTSTVIESTTITTSTTTTIYAACGPTNILGPEIQNGYYLSLSTPNDDQAQVSTPDGITDAYDCCVACITGNECQYSEYLSAANSCANFGGDDSVCSNPAFVAGSFSSTAGPNSFMAVYSNGPCGVLLDSTTY